MSPFGLVCFSGTYDIYVKIDGVDKCVGSYDQKGSFGELALMYNMPRAATIIATSEGSLWAMVRTTILHSQMPRIFFQHYFHICVLSLQYKMWKSHGKCLSAVLQPYLPCVTVMQSH